MHAPDPRRSVGRRIAVAVGLALASVALGAAPRLWLYGGAVARSSLLHFVVAAVEIGILAGFAARWAARPAAALGWSAAPVLVVSVGAALLERWFEATAPGSMYPAVLYREPPSLRLAMVMVVIQGVLWIALWMFVYVFPLTLAEARESARRAERFRRDGELARLRARIEPARVEAALGAIGEDLARDPRATRARLAAFAEELDLEATSTRGPHHSPPAPDRDHPRAPGLGVVSTPTLRDPAARARFAAAVLAIALLVALSVLARYAEHGAAALRLELLSALRITLEIGAFVWLAERAAARGRSVARTIAVSLIAAAALGVAFVILKVRLEMAFPGSLYASSIFTHPTPAGRQLVQVATSTPIHVGFWTLAYLYPLARDEAARRAARAAELRREAELARLRASLTPHFVRNALNVIAGLVTADPEEAQRLLRRLGDLLRELSLDEEHHPLAREIDWLRAYTELLEARHPDALSFRFSVDPRAASASVPRLLLQPLVENAVLHGALSREGGGEVRILAEMLDDGTAARLRLSIEDDGPGMREATREGALGVRLVRERLSAQAARGSLRFESSPRGTRAVIDLPIEAEVYA